MLDINIIRADPEAVKAAIARRGDSGAEIDQIVSVDQELRAASSERDEIRAEIRRVSKQVGTLYGQGKSGEAEELAAQSRELRGKEKALDGRCEELSAKLQSIMLNVPNMPSADAPDGLDEEGNVVVRTHGFEGREFGKHQRIPHWEIGAELGILDVERAVRLSGSMFVMYRGFGAQLLRALIAFGLERNRDLYEEVRPPTLVKSATMIGSGHLPKFAEDAYHVPSDDLWAIPTAEVSLTSMFSGEILDATDLPLRLMAHTSCYRREAGAAGRDTRGLLRVHEFDKVELYAFCTPAQGEQVHQEILERAESAIRELGLAYRVIDLACGDISGAGVRTFDIEVYAPGANRWLEVSSVSWCTDYQTRRANIRYREAGVKGTKFAHSLNGSALAVPRVWAALVETYRQEDGSIKIPEPLHPYLAGLTKIPA